MRGPLLIDSAGDKMLIRPDNGSEEMLSVRQQRFEMQIAFETLQRISDMYGSN